MICIIICLGFLWFAELLFSDLFPIFSIFYLPYLYSIIFQVWNFERKRHMSIFGVITSPLQVSASSRKRIRWQPSQCLFVLNPLMAWHTGTVTMMYSERLVLIIIVILNLIPRIRGEGHQSLIIIITTYLNCRNKAQLEHLPTAA